MVTMSRLENVSPTASLSDRWEPSRPSLTRDQKMGGGMEGEIPNMHGSLPRSTNQAKKLWSDMYFAPTSRNFGRHPNVGVNLAQKESSVFSSSLSDLFVQRLNISTNKKACQPHSDNITYHLDETEAHTLKSLLPDEEELFLGMVEGTGFAADAHHAPEDSEDVDLFSCSGGIELEADSNLLTQGGNMQLAGGMSPSHHWSSSGMVSSDYAYALHPSSKFPVVTSLHEGTTVENLSHSSMRVASAGNQFAPGDPSYSLGHVVLDKGCVPSFTSHPVPEVHNYSSIGIHRNILDSPVGFTGDSSFKASGNATRFMPQLGLSGHPMELNRGTFACSPEGSSPFHVPQPVSTNSSPSEHQASGTLYRANWPSFVNGDGAHCPVWLPGFPSVPHVVINTSSPVHHQQVGSSTLTNAPLWDRRRPYAGESLDTSGYLSGSFGSSGFPGSSPSHPFESSSFNVFPHAGQVSSVNLSKNAELLSPQQMRYLLHKRSTNGSMSFGSPNERVRSRRNEASSNYADRKQYELNIDRILRGEDTRTTLMIKNIPNKYTSNMLLATINEHHRGTYDFIYLPIDFKNKCNVGYAFINMIEPLHIVPFHETFDGKKWEKFNSEKVASLAYARIQGKDALVAHFQNSSLMNEDKRCRPILFHTHGPNAGDQEPFPMGTNIRSRPGRHHSNSDDEEGKSSNQSKYTGLEGSPKELDY